MTSVEPPEHVRATFGLREVTPISLGDWEGGWRFGDVVLSPVAGGAPRAGGGGGRGGRPPPAPPPPPPGGGAPPRPGRR
nr:hypothetical protein [Nocardia abscessus]